MNDALKTLGKTLVYRGLSVTAVLALTSLGNVCPSANAQTVLGTKNAQFTINGAPVFLLGFSYYGGLGASEDAIRHDLDEFQRNGFNWLRVWATWSAFENDV